MAISAIVLTALSGAATAGVLSEVNAVLGGTASAKALLGFVALAGGALLAGVIAQLVYLRLATDTVYAIRTSLCRQILGLPQRRLEELGRARLNAALTEDVPAIATAIVGMPPVLGACAAILAGIGYLGYMSRAGLVLTIAMMCGALAGIVGLLRIHHTLDRATRRAVGTLYEHFRGLLEGSKELRLHRPRRASFFENGIVKTAADVRRRTVAAGRAASVLVAWSRLLLFCWLGLLVFAGAHFGMSLGSMRAYAVVIVYLLSPIELVLGFLPTASRAAVALEGVRKLGVELSSTVELQDSPRRAGSFESLEVEGATMTYRVERDNRTFTLGPIELYLTPGRVVFIVGGNGSGKSTLAKMLAGIYPPERGEIRLDDTLVTDELRDWYRQHFSAIFPDFHVFDPAWGLDTTDEALRRILGDLQLDHKVSVENGTFSTTDLSSGQRKRLALVVALAENKPVYVFDEWASDQDPIFKRIFYTKILPGLKARKKLVIVVSHDERYFNVADQIIKLEEGMIVTDATAQFMTRLTGEAQPFLPPSSKTETNG